MEMVMMYQPGTLHKGIKLWNRNSGVNEAYFLPVLDELDCMSDKTQYNSVGNRIIRLVLDKEKIGEKAVFKIKGYASNDIVGRLDFVESILRRNVRGIRLAEVEVEGELSPPNPYINFMLSGGPPGRILFLS